MRHARLPLVALAALVLVGCTSAPPGQWLMYAHANYAYGRIQAKAEAICAPSPMPGAGEFCAEAAKADTAVRTAAPLVEAELSRSRPDWAVIMKYVDIAIGLAGKIPLVTQAREARDGAQPRAPSAEMTMPLRFRLEVTP